VWLFTAGWKDTSYGLQESMVELQRDLREAGIEIETRVTDAKVEEVETAIAGAHALSNRINSFETRWFLRGARDRDAAKLSKIMQTRLQESEALTLDDYRAALIERTRIRALYAELAQSYDGCITLSAPGGAPKGLKSTGSAAFAVPGSLLGVPALSLPVFWDNHMPLGLQVLGFFNDDARAFALAGWLRGQLLGA
jgi:Asp-tRNA(Asn)/Glu-tRNA(Gln) amidotransferase A subunit family amidase